MDNPCTGEPATRTTVYVVSGQRLTRATVDAVDFYKSPNSSVVGADPSPLSIDAANAASLARRGECFSSN